ncbi:MAG TPA: TolC family protein, partial [Thermodesulfovibrionales bacterium]|nr:TolC family protein [Thermodesulfovibrionales bacterium]
MPLAGATAKAEQGLNSAKISAYDVKLMDRDTLLTSLSMIYPIYTGGKRSSMVQQARIGVDTAKEESRLTDMQIVHDVKSFYYGTVLAENLETLGRETLERFEVTLELTEKLYKTGSGRVKKTDYLRTQVIVSSIRSALELLKSNAELAKSALVNAMGLDWRSRINLAETEIPFKPFETELLKMVDDVNQSNPQMAQIQLGIDASEAKIREARSGHLPVIALFGNANHIDN